jgi:hypothetical protein
MTFALPLIALRRPCATMDMKSQIYQFDPDQWDDEQDVKSAAQLSTDDGQIRYGAFNVWGHWLWVRFRPIADLAPSGQAFGMIAGRFIIPIAVCSVLGVVGACSTTSNAVDRCAVTSLDQVLADPLNHAGQLFCGRAVAIRPARSRITWLIRSADAQVSYDETAIVVATAGLDALIDFSGNPTAYYIEAKIDPMEECFPPLSSDNGETCLPLARPVFFHVTRAKKVP